MTIQTCRTCDVSKTLQEFSSRKGVYTKYCLQCRRVKNTPAVAKLRAGRYLELEQSDCCACGFNHPLAKEVHHLSGTYKRFGRSQDIKYNLEDIRLDRAIVLCANCHVIFHGIHGGKNKPFPLYTKDQTVDLIKESRNLK